MTSSAVPKTWQIKTIDWKNTIWPLGDQAAMGPLSELTDFKMRLLHSSLPTKKRMHRIVEVTEGGERTGTTTNSTRNRRLAEKYNNAKCPNCEDTDSIESHDHIFSECPALRAERNALKEKAKILLEPIVGHQWDQWWMSSDPPPLWQQDWQTRLGNKAAIPSGLGRELDRHQKLDQSRDKGQRAVILQQLARAMSEGVRGMWRARCKLWHERTNQDANKGEIEQNE